MSKVKARGLRVLLAVAAAVLLVLGFCLWTPVTKTRAADGQIMTANDLMLAIYNVQDGGTVTLGADIALDLNQDGGITGGEPGGHMYIPTRETGAYSFTLDLNGNTITIDTVSGFGCIEVQSGVTVTVKNGTLAGKSNGNFARGAAGSSISLENVTIDFEGLNREVKPAIATDGALAVSNVTFDLVNAEAIDKNTAVTYQTLWDELNLAADGAVVSLKENAVLDKQFKFTEGKKLTLDLGEYTLKIGAGMGNVCALDVRSGSLTIRAGANGAIDGTQADDTTVPVGVMAQGATLTIESGTITTDTKYESCVYAGFGGIAYIKGGKFVNLCEEPFAYDQTSPALAVNVHDGTSGQQMVISGGTFVGRNPVLGDTNVNRTESYMAADAKVAGMEDGSFVAFAGEEVPEGAVAVYAQSADEVSAEVYTAKALAAALADGNFETVVLGADITASVSVERTVTLDLNGKTLTNVAGKHTIENYGTLTVIGEGTVDNVSHGRGAVVNYGTAYLNGGLYTRSLENGQSSEDNGGNSWYVLKNYGSMTIDGAKVTQDGHYSSMIANGYQNATDRNTNYGKVTTADKVPTLVIESGEFAGGMNTVKNDDYAVMTINGGTFKNVSQAAVLNWNELTITDGVFEVGEAAQAAIITSYAAGGYDNGTTTISGGTFKGAVTVDAGAAYVKYSISGGNYSELPKAEYFAEGFAAVPNAEGGYDAVSEEDYMVTLTVNGTRIAYATLAEAVAAVPADNSEALIEFVGTEQEYSGAGIIVEAGRNIIIDFNNNTYIVTTTVGSSGTETNRFQLKKGSQVVMKDGTIKTSAEISGILIQKYNELTLENMVLDLSDNAQIMYVISNNNGTTTITGNTQIIAAAGKAAFDTYHWPDNGYGAVEVIFDAGFTGKVEGRIEYTTDGTDPEWQSETKLTFADGNTGTYDVDFYIMDGEENANVTVSDGTFKKQVPYELYAEGFVGVWDEEAQAYVTQEGTYVATIGEYGYTTLAEAFASAATGDTIKLISDVTVENTISVRTKKVTFDLCGYTVYGADIETLFRISNIVATFKNGTIEAQNVAFEIAGASGLSNNAVTFAEDLNIISENDVAVFIYNSIVLNTSANITAKNAAIMGNGQDARFPNINVLDGNITSTDAAAMYLPQKNGVTTISGGTITGTTGIEIRNGTLNITGGKIVATGETLTEAPNGNGNTVLSGAAVAVSKYANTGTLKVNISGGELEGVYTVYEKNLNADGAQIDGSSVNLSITDGKLSGEIFSENKAGFISGGNYSELPKAEYFAEGFAAAWNEEAQAYVTQEGTYVATIGEYGYTTLAEAFAAADGETVTLIADVTESVAVAEGKTVTLDLNGKTLTNVAGKHTIENYGTLTVIGEGTVDNVSHGRGAVVNYGTAYLNGGLYTRSLENGQSSEDNGGNSWYVLKNYGSMTIDGAKVTQDGHYSSMIANGYQNATDRNTNYGKVTTADKVPTLVIESGEFAGGMNTVKNDDYAVMTINGGTFKNVSQAAVLNWNELTITDGVFEVGEAAQAAIITSYAAGGYDNGTTTISGGTFKGAVTVDAGAAYVKYSISGGNYSVLPKAEYFAEGFAAAWDEETQAYVTQEGSYVATIDGYGYLTLDAAIKSVGASETAEIVLIKSIENEIVPVSLENILDKIPEGKYTSQLNGTQTYYYFIGQEQKITLDLNGNSITFAGAQGTTANGVSLFLNAGDLIVKDSKDGGYIKNTIANNGHFEAIFWNLAGANLYLESGIYNANLSVVNFDGTVQISGAELIYTDVNGQPATECMSVIFMGGTLKVKEGAFVQGVLVAMTEANFEIEGGRFAGSEGFNDSFGGEGSYSVVSMLGGSNVTVTGGTFESPLYVDSNSALEISGGVFAEPVAAKYLAEGYVFSVQDDKYVVVEGTAQTIVLHGEEEYSFASVADALVFAAEGDTVRLNADVTENVTIEKSVTIDLNGYSISSAQGYAIDVIGGLTQEEKIEVVILSTGEQGTIGSDSNNVGLNVKNFADVTVENVYAKGSIYGVQMGDNGSAYQTVVTMKDSKAEGTGFAGVYVMGTSNAELPVTLKAENSEFIGYWYGVTGNGTYHNTYIELVNCTVTGTAGDPDSTNYTDMGYGIYHPQDGTLIIDGGTVTGVSAGIEIRSGKLVVKGGAQITGTCKTLYIVENGSGTTVSGAAVAVSQHSTQKPIDVTIEEGTLTGLYALYETDTYATATPSENVEISITGGTLVGEIHSDNKAGFISGGRFSAQPAEEYFDPDYAAVYRDGWYVTVESTVLRVAQAQAQADVRMYAAALGLSWSDVESNAAQVIELYDAIAETFSEKAVVDAKLAAMEALEAYAEDVKAAEEEAAAAQALAQAKAAAQEEVRDYAAMQGTTWTAIANAEGAEAAAAVEKYNAIADAADTQGVADAKLAAKQAVEAYVAAVKAAEEEATAAQALAQAKAAAQEEVCDYAAMLGTTWTAIANAEGAEAAAAVEKYNAIADAADTQSVADAKLAAKQAVEAYVAAVNAAEEEAAAAWAQAKQDAIAALEQWRDENAEGIVIPTSVYLAVNSAETQDELNTYIDSAKAELSDILTYRGQIAALAEDLGKQMTSLEELSATLTALDEALTGENNYFELQLTDIEEIVAKANAEIKQAVEDAQAAIVSGDADSESLASLKAYLETINNETLGGILTAINGLGDELAGVDTALSGLSSQLSGLSGALTDVGKTIEESIAATQTKVQSIIDQLGSLATGDDITAVTGSLTAILEDIAKVQETVDAISVEVNVVTEVTEVKTQAYSDIKAWLDEYLDEIIGTDSASADVFTLRAYTPETTDGEIYAKLTKAFSEDNAKLVLKYYNEALASIDAAKTVSDVTTAVSTFKAQVASVEAAAQNTPDVNLTAVYVLLAVLLVGVVAAIVILLVRKAPAQAAVAEEAAPAPAEAKAEAEPVEEAKEAPAEEETAVSEAAAEDDDREQVVIAASVRTFSEAYEEMSEEDRDLFNKVREYALAKDDAKEVKQSTGVCVKRNGKQIVKLTIRRGAPVALFFLENEMLKDFRRATSTSAKLKVRATELVLREPADLDTAYMMVDLAVEQIEKDIENAKERRKEARRLRRLQKQAEEEAKAEDDKA